MYLYGTERKTDNGNSCLSKIKLFIKEHPFIFYSIIAGIVIVLVIIIVLCVVLTKKDKEEETEVEEEIKIYPLEESLKSEVMKIYNNIGNKDKGTLDQFSSYLSEKAYNLKEEQKVYLAYYWIINNIKYDYVGYRSGTYDGSPVNAFNKKIAVCSGYSRLFRVLLLAMNYTESKILNIQGYAKGEGYSSFEEPKRNHEWNAVEINGKWCLIDTTWDSIKKTEYYLCSPPKCFIRDHLPENNKTLQFLHNPISLETFHGFIQTGEGFCKYNLEIIEDKAIQNICGKGKIIIKYKSESEDGDNHIIIGSFNGEKCPNFFANRIESGFQIDLSVNNKGRSAIFFSLNNYHIGEIYFNCTEEPKDKVSFPSPAYHYSHSDAQLISPLEGNLIKGKTYNFELKTEDFEELTIEQENEKIYMTNDGNIFKGENIYIHENSISIFSGNNNLLRFSGIGDDVAYPYIYRSSLKLRLYQPLIGTLDKGKEYKFELKCESDENIRIKIGEEIIEMDKNNNIYTKTLTVDTSQKENSLLITYLMKGVNIVFDYELYRYKLN